MSKSKIIRKKKFKLPLVGQIVKTPSGWVCFDTAIFGKLEKGVQYVPEGSEIIYMAEADEHVMTERWADTNRNTRVLNKTTYTGTGIVFCAIRKGK